MPARAIPEASMQKQSSTEPAEKALDQNVAPMAVATSVHTGPEQIAAVHARTRVAVRPAKLAPEQRSSVTGAGSCVRLTSHDRRQRVAKLALSTLKTLQTGSSPTASRERLQKPFVRDASRAHSKRTQEREQ